MTSRSYEVMTVPIDANARVGKTLIAAVECYVVIDLAFVVFSELPGACKSGFLIRRKNKNQVSLCFDSGLVEGANCGE